MRDEPTSTPPYAPTLPLRAAKKGAELAAGNRYGRYLDLTLEETDRWATDSALRAECGAAAQVIADAFGTPITILACNGFELAIVEPATQALALHAN